MTLALPTTEETDPFCLPPLAAAALLHDAPWQRFAVIGDSLSLGTCDPSPGYTTLGWSDRVADVLRRVNPALAYLNTGQIGTTTAETLRHQSDPLREFAPDLLYLPCPANDIVRRTPDYDEIERNQRDMYRMASATGAELMTFTLGKAYVVPVFPDWTDRVRRINDLTRAIARDYDAIVIDMWDHPIHDRPNLLSADRLHFSASGQAVLATEAIKQLAHRLAATGARTVEDGPRPSAY
ncbi:SGNH/GDSL hydrolase family protein [Nocardia altamirensis]|uniref:SGNH/GDSL hydrolase family protein n=1 Tax=Nocardia altamirensis TaxID=472158 RepID=UPI00084076FB|nr:SGNH/GDSL hydrolase family protein [Nocardia altamirensis]